MEIPKAVKPLVKPAPDKRKPIVKFHLHCIILAASMTIIAIIISTHCLNETASAITGFVPNFLTEIFDRIKKV
jgi:hypothetical protein